MHAALVTFEHGADFFPDGDASTFLELAQSQFHVEERQTAEDQHQAIRNKESSCQGKWEGYGTGRMVRWRSFYES